MPLFMKLPELAAMFGVHQTSVVRWLRSGKFPAPVLIERRYFFDRDEVMSFIGRSSM
jgi:predicted DNA-binding transcriptional regulator AlpA